MTRKKKGPEAGRSFERLLPVKLTKAELASREHEVTEMLTAIVVKKGELATWSAPLRSEISELNASVEEMRAEHASGEQKRQVRCMEEKDYRANVVNVRRIDTRVVVETREMTTEERETQFPFPGAAKGSGKARARAAADAAEGVEAGGEA